MKTFCENNVRLFVMQLVQRILVQKQTGTQKAQRCDACESFHDRDLSYDLPSGFSCLNSCLLLQVDINLLSSSSGDMDSDLEVLEEVTNTRNGDTTGGESLMVRSGDQPAFGASIPHRASNKSKSVDPRIAEARRRNQEALERLRAAAAEQDESEVEELSEPDSPGKFS